MTTLQPISPGLPLVQSPAILHLPLGLLGLEHLKRYVLLSEKEEAPFSWLQVLDEPNLAFLILCPFEVMPDYRPLFSAEDLDFLELTAPEQAQVYGIVTLRAAGCATINLKGPLAFNGQTLRGKQVILTNASEYSLQHPLPLANPVETL